MYALSSTCKGNQKQIGVGMLQYADDNDGLPVVPGMTYQPAPSANYAVYAWYSRYLLGPYIGNTTDGSPSGSLGNGGRGTTSLIIVCPARPDLVSQMSDLSPTSSALYTGIGINDCASPPANNWFRTNTMAPIRIHQFSFPVRTVMVLDTVNLRTWVAWTNPEITADRPAYGRHGGSCNALFADGHVDGLKIRGGDTQEATMAAR